MENNNKYTSIDYIKWRGDLSFESAPFNEIDLFLCSQLVTPDFSGIVPVYEPWIRLEEAASEYFKSHNLDVSNLGMLQSKSLLPALLEMSKSVRYKDLLLCGFSNYVDHTLDEQFCALVMKLPDGCKIVAFRGTDDTLTGWKEDFNIAALDMIPAQSDALNYLIYVAEHAKAADNEETGDIIVTGHSKGGNLAVYAACMAPKAVRDRIRFAVNWDGPGFRQPFLESEGFRELNERNCIYNFLSQNSLVGTLLEPAGPRVFVRSYVSGPLAHDGFTWQVAPDHFPRVEELSPFSTVMEEAMKSTLGGMDTQRRREFIDGLFSALSSTGAVTISELSEQGVKGITTVLNNARTTPEVRSFLATFISNSFRLFKDEIPAIKPTELGINFNESHFKWRLKL